MLSNENKVAPVDFLDFARWWVAEGHKTGKRLGQAFVSRANQGLDPELFYEEDEVVAWQMITDRCSPL